jgi:hypothetical protein
MRSRRVAICFHNDSLDVLTALKQHLKPLERGGRLETWDATRIPAGHPVQAETEAALKSAGIALLLVCP